MYAHCRIPKDLTRKHFDLMIEACGKIDPQLFPALLEIDPNGGDWRGELGEDHADATLRRRDSAGVLSAGDSEKINKEIEGLELLAKHHFIENTLRGAVDIFIAPRLDKNLEPPEFTGIMDPLDDDKWLILVTGGMSSGGLPNEDYALLCMLAFSHVTRVDLKELLADEIVTEFEIGSPGWDMDGLLNDEVAHISGYEGDGVNDEGTRGQVFYLLNNGVDREKIEKLLSGTG